MQRVVLAGGGTAGHTSPLLATAEALEARYPGVDITVIGTARGIETRVIPAAGYPLELVTPVPLPRRLNADLGRLPFRLRRAVKETRAILRHAQPQVVVGFGGYVSVPVYWAAHRLAIPLVVHEGNALPGIANKFGARMTQHVATSFPNTPLRHGTYVGLPIRSMIASLDRDALRSTAYAYFGLEPERPTLLVTGGSQGARSINQAVIAAAGTLAERGIQVLHIVGPDQDISVPESTQVPYVIRRYVERMDQAYAVADLVLCRSGANTVTEVAAAGLPAIFVPLPHGNGEQAVNAAALVAADAALLVADAALSPSWLQDHVIELITNAEKLHQMGRRATAVLPTGAAERLVTLMEQAIAS